MDPERPDADPPRLALDVSTADTSPEKFSEFRASLAENDWLQDPRLLQPRGTSRSPSRERSRPESRDSSGDDGDAGSNGAGTGTVPSSVAERTPLLQPKLKAMLAADTKEEALARAAHYIQAGIAEHKVSMFGLTPLQQWLFHLRRKWWYLAFIRLNILVQLAVVVIEPVSFRSRENNHRQYLAEVLVAFISVSVQAFDVWVRLWPSGRAHWKSPWNTLNALAVTLNGLDVICRVSNVTTFQFSRTTRPLLLLAQSRRLRRTVTLIIRSLPPVIGITFLFAFVVFAFAHLGVVLFTGIYKYGPGVVPAGDFNSFSDASMALFTLITTENYPGIMYPAFLASNWAAIFFISFCLVHIVLASLMLSNIFDVYGDEHRRHITKSIIKEKRNFYLAFHILDRNGDGVLSFDEWDDLLRILRPDASQDMSRFMFSLLDTDADGTLQIEEFSMLADMLLWKFEEVADRERWQRLAERATALCGIPLSMLYSAVRSQAFAWGSKALVLFNAIFLWTTVTDRTRAIVAVEVTLLTLMTLELGIKLLGIGRAAFWQSYMDRWDSFVLLACWVLYALYQSGNVDVFVNVSSFRILDLYRVKTTYSGTVAQMLAVDSQFDSFVFSLRQTAAMIVALVVVLLCVMYTYAIVGMEVFNTRFNRPSDPPYDNPQANFDSFGHAMLTLFQVFLVNNWNDICYYAMYATGSKFVSWYFISYFWLVSSVMADLLVSMVMECFTRKVPENSQSEAFWVEGITGGSTLKVSRKRRWSREFVKQDLSEVDKGEMLTAAREALVIKLQHMHDRHTPSLDTRLRSPSTIGPFSSLATGINH